MDIEHAIREVLAGNRQAFAPLVERFRDPLFGYLWRLGLGRALAEEVAQEAFVRAWQNLASFRPERASFSTWLYTIARNLAFDTMARPEYRHSSVAEVDGEADQSPERATDPSADPAVHAESRQDARRLLAALGTLAPAERNALALSAIAGIPLADVAAIEGTSVAAIKVRVHRARRRLQALLAADRPALDRAPGASGPPGALANPTPDGEPA